MTAHPDTDYTVVPVLPTSGVQLHLPAGTITYNMKKEVSMARTTEPMKQYMIKKYGWDEETFLDIDWEAHRRGANRHHKRRTTHSAPCADWEGDAGSLPMCAVFDERVLVVSPDAYHRTRR